MPQINFLTVIHEFLSFCAFTYRYLMYLESGAWATNFKQKLACGSVVMAVAPTRFEFFSRALTPGVHYVEVTDST